MNGEYRDITVPEEYQGERIDRFLARGTELDFSRTYLQKLIREHHILVNAAPIKQNYRLRTDDSISITIPEPVPVQLEPVDIPLEILYEDNDLAVINKPPGLMVHPGPGNWERTLVNALLFHLKSLSGIGGYERPGIVHRLDKDTAGVMVVAKNDKAHSFMTAEFAERRVMKYYTAVTIGKPQPAHDVINAPLGRHPKYRHKMTIREDGREAVTEYDLKKIWNTGLGLFSQLDIRIHTGRTHQIRVHLSSKNLPIVGDPVYSKKWSRYRVPYLLLASRYLEFTHPASGERMTFSVPLPDHIAVFINKLEKLTAPAG